MRRWSAPELAPAARHGHGWTAAAVCLYAVLVPFQPVLGVGGGSVLRFAAADAIAPLVFFAALVRPRRPLPGGLALIAASIPLLALFSTLVSWNDRSLSAYAVGKTAGLFYLTGLCLAIVRCTPPGAEPAVLRALARGALWSAVVGLVGFAARLKGIATPLVSGERLCSTMPGDPNIYCSLLAVSRLRWLRHDDTDRVCGQC